MKLIQLIWGNIWCFFHYGSTEVLSANRTNKDTILPGQYLNMELHQSKYICYITKRVNNQEMTKINFFFYPNKPLAYIWWEWSLSGWLHPHAPTLQLRYTLQVSLFNSMCFLLRSDLMICVNHPKVIQLKCEHICPPWCFLRMFCSHLAANAKQFFSCTSHQEGENTGG